MATFTIFSKNSLKLANYTKTTKPKMKLIFIINHEIQPIANECKNIAVINRCSKVNISLEKFHYFTNWL